VLHPPYFLNDFQTNMELPGSFFLTGLKKKHAGGPPEPHFFSTKLRLYWNWVCGSYHELCLWFLPPLAYVHRAGPKKKHSPGSEGVAAL
jgi:hypothetical protein